MTNQMHNFLTLILLSTAMMFGSFLAGNIPMAFHLHEDNMLLMSSFGSGLLVGTALIVIIPEGAHSLYTSASSNQVVPSIQPIPPSPLSDRSSFYEDDDSDDFAQPHQQQPLQPPLFDKRSLAKHDHDHADGPASSHEGKKHDHDDNTHALPSYVGLSLVSGFALMFLIDQMSHHQHHHRHSHVAISDLRGTGMTPTVNPHHSKKRLSASIGMIVHAAADGIALGAAAASGTSAVKIIVFIAIILHKAPSAFGLTTFLLHDGASKKATQRYLLAFSCAAPVTAILTFLLLQQISLGTSTEFWTGLLLLFSGGTFLYVATVHILPEVYSNGMGNNGNRSGSYDTYFEHKHLSRGQILFILGGLFFPMLLNLGHSH